MNETYYVYMLRSIKKPNVLKISSTDNLEKMLERANMPTDTIAGWLSPWELLLTESYGSHSEALQREALLREKTFSDEELENFDY